MSRLPRKEAGERGGGAVDSCACWVSVGGNRHLYALRASLSLSSRPRRLHATMTACCSRFLRRSCKRACRWIAVRPSSLVSTTRVVGSVLLLYGSVSSVAMPCTVVEYSGSLRCVAAKVKTLCTPRELWEQKVPVELDYFCVHPSPAVMSSCDCMNVRVGGSGSRKSPLNLTISASVHRPVLNSD
jgi:hypothetical protein